VCRAAIALIRVWNKKDEKLIPERIKKKVALSAAGPVTTPVPGLLYDISCSAATGIAELFWRGTFIPVTGAARDVGVLLSTGTRVHPGGVFIGFGSVV